MHTYFLRDPTFAHAFCPTNSTLSRVLGCDSGVDAFSECLRLLVQVLILQDQKQTLESKETIIKRQ